VKILLGTLGRGHVERYRKEMETAVRATALRDVEFDYDVGERGDAWGNGIEDCSALVILSTRGFSGEAITRAKRLAFVQKIGLPYGIDVDACRKRGIAVAAVPDMNHRAVAEHTVMFMLGMTRHALTGHAAVMGGVYPAGLTPVTTTQSKRHSNWLELPRDSFNVLAGQTVGLIGFGDIAQHVASLARCFGMTILYTKRTRLSPETENRCGVAYADMAELLRNADFVSLHATLPEAGRPIIGSRELAAMKSTAVLINTARGNQVDQAALIECLRSGRIGGACLDVFETEPVPAHEFSGLANVLLTPHTAGVTPWRLRFRGALENIEAFLDKRPVAGLL
jgi:phosphoglycerate dehydrogenase-like enzyme